VIDEEGNAASVTLPEGSSMLFQGRHYGQCMLGESDLNPHGFHQWQENAYFFNDGNYSVER